MLVLLLQIDADMAAKCIDELAAVGRGYTNQAQASEWEVNQWRPSVSLDFQPRMHNSDTQSIKCISRIQVSQEDTSKAARQHHSQRRAVKTSFSTTTALPPPAELQLVAQVDHAAGSATTVPPLLTIAAPLTPDTNASLSLSVPGESASFRTESLRKCSHKRTVCLPWRV